jgi:hypothetical protein
VLRWRTPGAWVSLDLWGNVTLHLLPDPLIWVWFYEYDTEHGRDLHAAGFGPLFQFTWWR